MRSFMKIRNQENKFRMLIGDVLNLRQCSARSHNPFDWRTSRAWVCYQDPTFRRFVCDSKTKAKYDSESILFIVTNQSTALFSILHSMPWDIATGRIHSPYFKRTGAPFKLFSKGICNHNKASSLFVFFLFKKNLEIGLFSYFSSFHCGYKRESSILDICYHCWVYHMCKSPRFLILVSNGQQISSYFRVKTTVS